MTRSITHALIFFLLFVVSGCSDNSDQSVPASAGDSSHLSEAAQPDVVVLKDLEIDGKIMTRRITALPDSEVRRLSIQSIDSAFSDAGGSFKYFMADTLYAGSSGKVLFILRQYAEENIGWAASYDQSWRLLDKLQVYYDNAEGNLAVTSSIKNNSIVVNSENVYGETPDAGKAKKIYAVGEGYRFVTK